MLDEITDILEDRERWEKTRNTFETMCNPTSNVKSSTSAELQTEQKSTFSAKSSNSIELSPVHAALATVGHSIDRSTACDDRTLVAILNHFEADSCVGKGQKRLGVSFSVLLLCS